MGKTITMGTRASLFCRMFCGLAALAWASGCERPKAEAATKDGEDPVVLRLGYAPSDETVVDREKASRVLAEYLGRRLGVSVELVQTASYGPALDALAGGAVDLVALTPFAYVLASDRGLAEALVVLGTERKGPRTYRSAIVTHRRTGLERLEDLAARAEYLRFNFTDPASNSGHLVPRARLAGLGIDAEKDFGRTEFTLSHNVAVLNVEFGLADVAGVSNTTLQRLFESGRASREALVVLWVSDELPNGPMAVRTELPAAFKRRLREALLELPKADPEASRAVMAPYEAGSVFVACEDALYDGLRALGSRPEAAVAER